MRVAVDEELRGSGAAIGERPGEGDGVGAETLLQRYGIPFLDTTECSIEVANTTVRREPACCSQ